MQTKLKTYTQYLRQTVSLTILSFIFSLSPFFVLASEVSSTQNQNDVEFNAGYYFKFVANSSGVNLLNLAKVDQKFPLPVESYNRKKHFSGWLDDQRDNSCLNTRGLILERSSEVPVEYGGARGCTVVKGKWYDPYTDSYFEDAVRDLQIDHLVPLKHAYMAGAYEWSKKKRCLYSNYMWNEFHLIPTLGRENSKKGDKSPVSYLPENKKYICDYLKSWLKVKVIWSLRVSPLEKQAIEKAVQDNKCKSSEFYISSQEIETEHKSMEENVEICSYNYPPSSVP